MSVYYYRCSDYQASLEEANAYHIPGLFWPCAHRITALAQLGSLDEAKEEYLHLLGVRPDFVERGRYMMNIHIKEALLLDHLLEGF